MSKLTLRPATDADSDLLFRLYASTRTEELARAPWTDQKKQQFLRDQFRLQDVHYRSTFPDGRFALVLRDRKAVGRLYVAHHEGALVIVDLSLFPRYRGRGFGSRLIRDVQEEAARSGKPVRVHVLRNHRANGLYRRLGFEKINETGLHDLMRWNPPPRTGTET